MHICRRATILLAVLAAGCLGPSGAEPDAGLPCAGSAPTAHDRQLLRRLEQAMERLASDGSSTALADLAPQLEVSHCGPLPLPDHPSGRPMAPADVQERIRSAVVVVGKRYLCGRCDRWHLSTASGFFATTDGVVVTSRHVLDGGPDSTFAILTADGAVQPVVAVLAADEAADVVLLRVAGDGFDALPLRAGARVGEPIHVLSHPDSAFWFFSTGVVARRYPFRGRGGETELLDVTADFARGSSGAPVVDATGSVVGVVRATDSVYYEEHDGEQRNLQMVFKRCAPAEAVLQLAR